MAWIDENILQFKGNDLSVMIYLVTHANEEGICKVSYGILSEELGLSIQSCRTAIRHLKLTSKLTSKSTNKITNITICDYDSYNRKPDSSQQANQQANQQVKIDELSAKVIELERLLEEEKAKKTKPTVPKTLEERDQRLKERAHEFGQTLIPFLVSYPKEMIRKFYDYWIEPNKSHTKMRFELEKTWDVKRRLETWANNNRNFGNNNYGRETATDRLKRTFNEANEFRNQLAAQREADLEAGDS